MSDQVCRCQKTDPKLVSAGVPPLWVCQKCGHPLPTVAGDSTRSIMFREGQARD